MNDPTSRDRKAADADADRTDDTAGGDLPGDAKTPTEAGPLESLGRAITSPVRDAEPEPGTPNVRPSPDGERDREAGDGGSRGPTGRGSTDRR